MYYFDKAFELHFAVPQSIKLKFFSFYAFLREVVEKGNAKSLGEKKSTWFKFTNTRQPVPLNSTRFLKRNVGELNNVRPK